MLKKLRQKLFAPKVPKAKGAYLEFANDPKHPVRVVECDFIQEKNEISALLWGHEKRRIFSADEVNAILVETETGEIVRFDKTAEA